MSLTSGDSIRSRGLLVIFPLTFSSLIWQRQTALKKKQDELLSSSRRGAESDSSSIIGNAAALPFHTSDEVSGLLLLS